MNTWTLVAATNIPLLTVAGSAQAAGELPRVASAGTMRSEMLYRELGSTGEQVSVIGMGGSHLGRATLEKAEAIRLIQQGLDRGIDFLDNCWDYNEGRSERPIGNRACAGRLSPESVSGDQDRWPHQRPGDESDQHLA